MHTVSIARCGMTHSLCLREECEGSSGASGAGSDTVGNERRAGGLHMRLFF
jgi:hypothetical protein